MMSNTAQSLDILVVNLNVLHEYFDSIKLFSDLYLIKFLDTAAKLFFPCNVNFEANLKNVEK